MLFGVIKTSPIAGALVAALSIQNVALFIAVATAVSGVLALGAVVTMAKAWRERAEARTDEALQLEQKMQHRDEKIANLEGKIEELARRPDLRGIRDADAAEHHAIIQAVDRLSGQFSAALDRNTAALETFSRHVPWEDIAGAPHVDDVK